MVRVDNEDAYDPFEDVQQERPFQLVKSRCSMALLELFKELEGYKSQCRSMSEGATIPTNSFRGEDEGSEVLQVVY